MSVYISAECLQNVNSVQGNNSPLKILREVRKIETISLVSNVVGMTQGPVRTPRLLDDGKIDFRIIELIGTNARKYFLLFLS